jgi:hypothetical protein
MTLGLHADPDLAAATEAAERAIYDRLTAAGYTLGPVGHLASVLAEVAVGAAWASLKRATRRPTEDGRP